MTSPEAEASSTSSQRELAVRAQVGDEAAFALLYRRLGPGLERYLLRRTGSGRSVVEELAQSTWVEVWRLLQLGRYDPGRAAFSTFLYAVASRVVLRHRRAVAREGRRQGESLPRALEADLEDPAELLDLCQRVEALQECLNGACCGLTAEERELVLGVGSGVSERELARRLGIPSSTAHDRKRAAYRKLRQCLGRKGLIPDRPPPARE